MIPLYKLEKGKLITLRQESNSVMIWTMSERVDKPVLFNSKAHSSQNKFSFKQELPKTKV